MAVRHLSISNRTLHPLEWPQCFKSAPTVYNSFDLAKAEYKVRMEIFRQACLTNCKLLEEAVNK